jgi:hypothetical protein
MKIAFECRVCGKPYEVDAAQAGRRGRCAKCGEEMTVSPAPKPAPRQATVPVEAYDGYALDDLDGDGPSSYTPPRGDEDFAPPPLASDRPAKPKGLTARMKKVKPGQFAKWRGPLIGLGVAVAALALMVLIFPSLAIVLGAIIVTVGMILALGGFAVGAYAAFCEDFVYGFLYLVLTPFTAWYIVSRFEELKAVALAIALGLGLSLVGGWALEYGHGPVDEHHVPVNGVDAGSDDVPAIKAVPRPGAARPGR